MFRMPVWLIQPLMTSIPGSTSRGMDSPVRAEVSRVEKPLRIVPSSGDALSRFHNNGFSDLNLVRVNLNQFSRPFRC